MSITISMEQIENLITSVENSPPDLSPNIQKGDWVELNPEGRGEAYCEGHVAFIHEDGSMALEYGSKTLSAMFRIRGQVLIHPSQVIEVWRQIDVVKREKVAGMEVTSVELEWVRVR